MNNLKRVLSLGLTGTMLAGMMVMGAGAADFKDADKIENADAVNTMVALNIINGKDDGNFDPAGIVTRAEMAKMITIALNGGKEPVLGTKVNPSYTDIKGNWAESYIEYCSSLKIINGRGDGTFDPTGTVTGSEAAKMMLVAMGWDSAVFGFTGADWAINVNIEANNTTPSLYEDLESIDPSAGMSRDNAAQLIFNGVQSKTMEKTPSKVVSTGEITYNYDLNGNPILNSKYGAAVKYGYMTDIAYDSDKKEYTYTFTGADFGSDAIAVADQYAGSLKTKSDVGGLYGQQVKVIYKNSNKDVYGIFAHDSSVLVSGVVGSLPTTIKTDDTSVKYNSVSYKLDHDASATNVYDFNGASVDTLNSYKADGTNIYAFDFIDNDDNGKVNAVVVHPVTAAKVTFVGKSSITAGNVSYKFDDCSIYEGVAKDDYVAITAKANSTTETVSIAKLEMVTGAVGAVKVADKEYRIGDTWYTLVNSPIGSLTMTAGDEVKVAVLNGYVVGGEIVEGTALTDVLYVAAVDTNAGTAGDGIPATLGEDKGVDTRVLLADGTNKVVKAMRVDVTTVATGISAADSDLVKAIPANGLYTYSVNKNGVYELKAVKAAGVVAVKAATNYAFAAANLPSSTSYVAEAANTYDKSDAKIGAYFISDDAVFFLVQTSDGAAAGTYVKGKVVTGKELKTMADFGDKSMLMTKSVKGLASAVVGVITDNALYGGTDVSTGYGYITSAGYSEKNADGDWTVKFTAWTADGSKELTAVDSGLTASSANSYTEGAFIYYTNTATAGEITGMTAISTQGAIEGYDGDKNINVNGTNYTFKDDAKTVVIFVDTANTAGVEGGSIELAQELSSGNYVKNAVYKVTSSELDVLFVDTANKLDGAGYTATFASNDPAAVNSVDVSGYTVTKADDASVSTGDTLVAGSTVKVVVAGSGTASAATTITVTVTLADSTTIVKTISVASGAVFAVANVTFTMPYQNVTGIAVTAA